MKCLNQQCSTLEKTHVTFVVLSVKISIKIFQKYVNCFSRRPGHKIYIFKISFSKHSTCLSLQSLVTILALKAFSHKKFTLPIILFLLQIISIISQQAKQFIVSENDNYIAQCSALTYHSYKTSGMAEMAALTDTFGNGDSCNNTDHVQK